MFAAKIIGIVVVALLVIVGGVFAYVDYQDAQYKAEQKAGFEQMREMGKHPADLDKSPATWGR